MPTSPSEGDAASRPTPFRRLLVANRGEIALRIMRTARALGYGTVAVHSTVDAGAPHVAAADRSVCIGEAAPERSYLNGAAIVEAARRSGADAIHPGYGFLSESPAFAAACVEAGLVFVGPAAATIAAMGNKANAKARMQALGIPCLPGYDGTLQDEAALAAEADRVGYPVMIKARSGGGGRGMRLVDSAGGFAAALRSARSEALRAFGDDAVLLERAVLDARHIELQVVADRRGRVVHLGERDCSVQRRHQKLLEETPSPALTAAQREQLAARAVKAVEAMGYEGVGTLEFLLEPDGSFWFMEMNTRLQVEHGVTEAVTGLDLVELQLRVAAGEPLAFDQAGVRFDGHAIQARICTEEPSRGFAPCSGEVLRWRPPPAVRVETALTDGARVAAEYDSLAAKVVAHGRTRAEALRKLAVALDRTVLLGVPTNRAFLARCLRHPAFVAGAATTGFIEDHPADLLDDDLEGRSRLDAIATLLRVLADRPASASAGLLAHVRRSSLTVDMTIDARPVFARMTVEAGDRATVEVDGIAHRLQAAPTAGEAVLVACDGVAGATFSARASDRSLWVHVDGVTMHLSDASSVRGAAQGPLGTSGAGSVLAAMDGRVIRVDVRSGSQVEAGQALLSVEAMKMEHLHIAPFAGRVAAVHVTSGSAVLRGQALVDLVGS